MAKKRSANPTGYLTAGAVLCILGGLYVLIIQGNQTAWIALLGGVAMAAWLVYDNKRQRSDDS